MPGLIKKNLTTIGTAGIYYLPKSKNNCRFCNLNHESFLYFNLIITNVPYFIACCCVRKLLYIEY